MTDHLRPRLLAAAAVVREAGQLARRHFDGRKSLEIEHKGHQDVVSIADRAVEDLMRERLSAAFPHDGLLGEEGGGEIAERLWVIDPIDGTQNFLRGLPYWCVCLAYVEHGDTLIGATYDPVHDELFLAQKGRGAFRDGEVIHVSGCGDPKRACVGLSFNFKQNPAAYLAMLKGFSEHGMDHRRAGSTALHLCHVADGRLDATVSLHTNSWDVLGGLLLVREAGGLATEFGPRMTEPRAVLGCTPGIRGPFEQAVGMTV